jgi:hypothetical protein
LNFEQKRVGVEEAMELVNQKEIGVFMRNLMLDKPKKMGFAFSP